jgi:hypothetical protein
MQYEQWSGQTDHQSEQAGAANQRFWGSALRLRKTLRCLGALVSSSELLDWKRTVFYFLSVLAVPVSGFTRHVFEKDLDPFSVLLSGEFG